MTAAARKRPVDAPPPLDIYAKPAKFEQMALSRDGSQVAFVTSYSGMHLLVAYRFAEHSRRAVKLKNGAISALSWIDDDRVMLRVSAPALRATCDAGEDAAAGGQVRALEIAEGTTAAIAQSQQAESQAMGQPQGGAQAPGPVSNLLLSSGRFYGCVRYGVRTHDALTLVDLNTRKGVSVGERSLDAAGVALGSPALVSADGKTRLVGAFMDLPTSPPIGRPAQRVYLWNIDTQTGRGRLVNDGGGDLERQGLYVDDWVLDPSGAPIARSVYDYFSHRFSIQMKAQGRWKPILTRQIADRGHSFAPSFAGLGRDGSSILIVDAAPETDARPGARTYHYYELTAAGALSGPLDPDDAAHDRPLFSPVTGRLAGFVRTGESDTYALSEPDLQEIYQHAQDAAPGETVRVVSTAQDPRKMIIYTVGRDDPGSYYFIDLAQGTSERIGDDYPDLASDWVANQSWVSYKAADGLALNGLVTLPPRAKAGSLPIVVLPHDGPHALDAAGFDWLAQALASRGYLVFQPNYRGSDGYGPALARAGFGQWGRKMQSDLSDGVAYLAAQGLADPKRVCILGIGYGGYAALLAAAQAPTYRCAAAIDGISDPAAYLAWRKAHDGASDQEAITDLVADTGWPRAFRVNSSSLAMLHNYMDGADKPPSPVQLSDRVSMPVLLVRSDADGAVPATQSAAMRDALKQRAKPVDYVEIKRDDHAPTEEAARLATLTAVTAFLAKNNPAD